MITVKSELRSIVEHVRTGYGNLYGIILREYYFYGVLDLFRFSLVTISDCCVIPAIRQPTRRGVAHKLRTPARETETGPNGVDLRDFWLFHGLGRDSFGTTWAGTF